MSEAIEGATPAPGRVRPLVLFVAGAILLTGALVTLGIFLFSPSESSPELSVYDQRAIAILNQQSEINGEWNALLDELSAPVAVTTDAERIEQFNASLVKARSVVNDSQAIIVRWRKLEPPPENVTSHSLALDAMTATQSGFIAMQEYLEQAASSGIADAALIEESQARIDEATGLWEQARLSDVE